MLRKDGAMSIVKMGILLKLAVIYGNSEYTPQCEFQSTYDCLEYNLICFRWLIGL